MLLLVLCATAMYCCYSPIITGHYYVLLTMCSRQPPTTTDYRVLKMMILSFSYDHDCHHHYCLPYPYHHYDYYCHCHYDHYYYHCHCHYYGTFEHANKCSCGLPCPLEFGRCMYH